MPLISVSALGQSTRATIDNAARARTITTKVPRPKTPSLSLNHFLQRQRVLALYRRIIRSTNKIPPSGTRIELKAFARTEFERNQHVGDLTQIRYLISTGREQFEEMKRYILAG